MLGDWHMPIFSRSPEEVDELAVCPAGLKEPMTINPFESTVQPEGPPTHQHCGGWWRQPQCAGLTFIVRGGKWGELRIWRGRRVVGTGRRSRRKGGGGRNGTGKRKAHVRPL